MQQEPPLLDIKPVYTDQVEVVKLLKVYKEARFKVFRTEAEARQFSTTQLLPPPDTQPKENQSAQPLF